jgi:hypothetical protein
MSTVQELKDFVHPKEKPNEYFFSLLVDTNLAHEGFLFPITINDICPMSYFLRKM